MLIQLSAIWGAKNPSKNEVDSGIDCAALPAPGVMKFTEPRGMMTIPSRVHLDFPENLGVVQFGIDLYSLAMVVQFRIDLS